MKRRNSFNTASIRKKPLLDSSSITLKAQSILEETEQYRLITAKFPIDALTPEWSVGFNRPLSESHKRNLCRDFKNQGVHRKELANRLYVACTKEEVQK